MRIEQLGRREVLLASAGVLGGCVHSAALRAGPVSRVTFLGGAQGEWTVERLTAPRGPPLAPVAALRKIEAPEFAALEGATWALQGVRSNERYVEKREHVQLAAIQAGLGRPESSCAALLPMSKSKAWWELSQDERRAILEERSGHIAKGSRYLPAIARRLFHGRDLGAEFGFLTWFEFSPADRGAFEALLGELRRTEEWQYVEREVDVRLVRTP